MTATAPLLAYSVTTEWSEYSVIVFAPTVATAKAEALGADWLSDEAWPDLRVKRQPSIDHAAEQFGRGSLDFSTPEQVALARGLGWYEAVTGPEEPCSKCDLHEWTLLPGSAIQESGLCRDCEAS